MSPLHSLLLTSALTLTLTACQTPTSITNPSAPTSSEPAVTASNQISDPVDSSLCKDNNGEACFYTGMKYFRGDGVEKNYTTAFEYNKRACQLGINYGCFGAGFAYVQGRGTEKNLAKSVPYFLKSCDLGAHDGCFNIAILNEQGEGGLKKDSQKAFEYFKKACDMGHTQACKRFKEYTLRGFK